MKIVSSLALVVAVGGLARVFLEERTGRRRDPSSRRLRLGGAWKSGWRSPGHFLRQPEL